MTVTGSSIKVALQYIMNQVTEQLSGSFLSLERMMQNYSLFPLWKGIVLRH